MYKRIFDVDVQILIMFLVSNADQLWNLSYVRETRVR